MKTNILKSTIAILLGAASLAVADEPNFRPKDDAADPKDKQEHKETHSFSSSTATVANGEVTIEIDVNGKKEKKTFKLGEGGGPFMLQLDGGDVKAAAAGGKAALGELLKKGKAALGKLEKVTWLGVGADPVSDELRAQLPLQPGEGLVVRSVIPDSPAAKAGLEEHDVVTRLDDQILVSGDQLSSLVKMHKPGEAVRLTYLRKGEKKEVSATLVEHESEPADALRVLTGPGGKFDPRKLDILRSTDQLREAESRLRELRDKLPGVIMEKKAYLIGPNGVVEKYANEKAEQLVETVRKELEKAQITPEQREEVRKSVEEAVRNAREAAEKAEILLKQVKEKSAPLAPPTDDKKP